MTRPTVGNVAELLYEAVAPLAYADEENDWALLKICEAVGTMLETVYNWAIPDEDVRPGWSVLLDLDDAPEEALAWLAQFKGVRLPDGITASEARTRIANADGFDRGTIASMRELVSPLLTGTKTIHVRERYSIYDPTVDSAYHIQVRTLTDETPDSDAVLAVLEAWKPAGLILNYQTVAGQSWQDVIDGNASWTAAMAAYDTWQELIDDEP